MAMATGSGRMGVTAAYRFADIGAMLCSDKTEPVRFRKCQYDR